jgi:hexosaminidase
VIPAAQIVDQPRYRWRGMLLDCGRHFMDKAFVKRYIDLLAYHKMNVLHWHLTEDQGWRIEIKKYPKLAEISAWRKTTRSSELTADPQGRYGGFYSQDDVREVVEYARSRYITVVPEIEMPGHSQAALAAYPELSCTGGPFEVQTEWGIHKEVYCAGNDKTFQFLEDVLTEVVELFPSEFIHVGGDECPKDRWKACQKCQARIKAEGLKDEHELQSYFIRRMERFLNSKGRRLVGWDEILEGGLAPNATVQSWRGLKGAIAAATTGHDVVSSPTSNCYLDYAQMRMLGEPTWMGYLPLERAYAFEPTPAELTEQQAKHVLGLEGNMWTEWAPQSRVDWQVFPRLCALAEVGWSPGELRDWDDFQRRMATHYQRLDELGVTYFVPPPKCVSRETIFTDAVEVALENPLGRGDVRYTLDGSEPTAESARYEQPLRLTETVTIKARTFLAPNRVSGVMELQFRKLAPLEPELLEGAREGLRYAYYLGRWRQLPGFAQLTPAQTGIAEVISLSPAARDERFALDFDGHIDVPADGTYTFHLTSDDGSRLWIGDELVVDHDSLHAASTQSGQVMLVAGLHPIRVAYFQAGGARRLTVEWEGPGVARQEVPAAVLWHSLPE